MDYIKRTSPPRGRILVLVRFNEQGPWIEVYGEREHIVRIQTVPTPPTRRSEALVEDLLELQLPWNYRQLYSPGKLLQHDVVRQVRPSVLFDSDHALQVLRGLASLEHRLASNGQEVIEWVA